MKRGDGTKLMMLNLRMKTKTKINPITSDLLLSNIDVYFKLVADGGTISARNASTNGKDSTSLANTTLTTTYLTTPTMNPPLMPYHLPPPAHPDLPNDKPQ